MPSPSFARKLLAFATNAVRNAPETADKLKRAGGTLVEAGELVGQVVNPAGPIRTMFDAVREGRIALDTDAIAEGRIGVKVRDRNAVASGGKVRF